MNSIAELARWLRLEKSSVHRNLKKFWSDMPRETSKRGMLNSYKFNKQDVWDYFKRKFN